MGKTGLDKSKRKHGLLKKKSDAGSQELLSFKPTLGIYPGHGFGQTQLGWILHPVESPTTSMPLCWMRVEREGIG